MAGWCSWGGSLCAARECYGDSAFLQWRWGRNGMGMLLTWKSCMQNAQSSLTVLLHRSSLNVTLGLNDDDDGAPPDICITLSPPNLLLTPFFFPFLPPTPVKFCSLIRSWPGRQQGDWCWFLLKLLCFHKIEILLQRWREEGRAWGQLHRCLSDTRAGCQRWEVRSVTSSLLGIGPS